MECFGHVSSEAVIERFDPAKNGGVLARKSTQRFDIADPLGLLTRTDFAHERSDRLNAQAVEVGQVMVMHRLKRCPLIGAERRGFIGGGDCQVEGAEWPRKGIKAGVRSGSTASEHRRHGERGGEQESEQPVRTHVGSVGGR
ncbi:MAG: hypothetical protein RLY72_2670 [Planctomycetota bacterium]